MPSLNHLNPPPNPFWDFVAGIEDHPFFGAYGRPPRYAFRQNVDPQADQPRETEAPQATTESAGEAKDKQPSVEDPPEVDPASIGLDNKVPEEVRDIPFRGRGRFGAAFGDGADGPRRGPGCGKKGRGGHHEGPPPFMFGPFGPGPWWARHGGPPGHEQEGPGHRRGGGPPHPAHEGPGHCRRGGLGHRGGPPHHHHHGPHAGSPPRDGLRHRGGPPRGGRGFDLGQFLNNLGERLGVDLAGAAEGLGADRFTGPRQNQETDFEPRADIFDTPTNYTIHVSLPGAKKDDVGVDWDGEHSVLRIAGVVHRPGVDEQLLSQLVVDGRKRENGVFEKSIRLGTKQDPASIDIAGITAKMTDGVLLIKVPKVEVEHKTREVPISGSSTPSPHRDTETANEKLLFDADEEMNDADSTPTLAPVSANDTGKGKEKETEHENEKEVEVHDNRSEILGHEEQLPQYATEEPHEESDWEKYGSDEEGEYVKINVD